MSYFNVAVEQVFRHEGGYVNDPDDRGGATNYGISLRFYREAINPNATAADIEALSKDDARKIYKEHWWDRYEYDLIEVAAIAIKLFDTAVNVGQYFAIIFAQQACNSVYAPCSLAIDGRIGPNTRAALHALDPSKVLMYFRALQRMHYQRLVENSPQLGKFEQIWMNRAYA